MPPLLKGEFMIYLKGIGGDVRVFKDCDLKEVKNLTDSGQWVRINGRRDFSDYTDTAKKTSTKKTKNNGS